MVEFGESVYFRCCAVSMWDITRDLVPRSFLTPDGVKRGTRIARMLEHERWDRVFSATFVGVPWQLRSDQRNLVRPVVPEAEQGVAPVIVMPLFRKLIGGDTSRREIS